MALIKMKRFHMLAMKEEKDALLRLLQSLGCVQISEAQVDDAPLQDAPANYDLERIKWAIGFLGKHSTVKKPLFASDVYISQQEAERIYQRRSEIMELIAQAEAVEKEQGKISSEHLKLDAELEELRPWANLSIPLSDIRDTAETHRLLGTMPTSAWAKLSADSEYQSLLALGYVVSEITGTSYLALVIHKDDYAQAMKLLKDAGFVSLAVKAEGTIAAQLQALEAQRKALHERSAALKTKLVELAQALPQLEQLYDLLSIEQERAEQSTKLYNTESSFYIKGWIPENTVDNVQKAIAEQSFCVELEISEAQDDEEPPVLMQNNPIVTPFESVVKGFSYPAPNGMDPTALMMPFFANFFGMMLSDAGYGILMAIAIPIIIKKFNPKLSTKNMLKLLLWGAGFTVLWGALFNTWFGFAPFPALLNPVDEPLPVMMVCLAVGAVHLFAGLFAAVYMNIKKGDYLAAVFDQISWASLLIGLGLLIVPATAGIGQILALVGAGIIILTAGRGSKNIFGRLIGGFGALYGITGWVSDLLSYMRLFGMGLATGVIGQVINILVGMIFESGIIGMIIGSVIFVAAHLFNFGINALGAYVHSCRLQYIEFFGKFYEDGGKPFTPLCEKTRYIQISKEK